MNGLAKDRGLERLFPTARKSRLGPDALSDQPKLPRVQTPTFYFENVAEVSGGSVFAGFLGSDDRN